MSDRVPTRFVNTLLRMAGDRGYDFSAILSSAGLDFDPLRGATTLRFSYARSTVDIREGLARLKTFMQARK